jgi:hypothetical protein
MPIISELLELTTRSVRREESLGHQIRDNASIKPPRTPAAVISSIAQNYQRP